MNPPWVYMCSPSWTPLPSSSHSIPLGHSSTPAPSTLYHASNLDWWFVSCMVIYMFQCHSPKSSYHHPLPQSPKDCSMHLCLFCCLAQRVTITIFLHSFSRQPQVCTLQSKTFFLLSKWIGSMVTSHLISFLPRQGSMNSWFMREHLKCQEAGLELPFFYHLYGFR